MTEMEELTGTCAVFAASFASLLRRVSLQVDVMNMFGSVFNMSGISDCVKSTMEDPVPGGLRFVSMELICIIIP